MTLITASCDCASISSIILCLHFCDDTNNHLKTYGYNNLLHLTLLKIAFEPSPHAINQLLKRTRLRAHDFLLPVLLHAFNQETHRRGIARMPHHLGQSTVVRGLPDAYRHVKN